MVDNADVALQGWGRRSRRLARFRGGRGRRTSSPAVAAVGGVDVVYEEQAGAHGDGQEHSCSMALGGGGKAHKTKPFPVSKKKFFNPCLFKLAGSFPPTRSLSHYITQYTRRTANV